MDNGWGIGTAEVVIAALIAALVVYFRLQKTFRGLPGRDWLWMLRVAAVAAADRSRRLANLAGESSRRS